MKYRKGYKYQLAVSVTYDLPSSILEYIEASISTQFISLDTLGRLNIKSGYAWDGPSGPTIDTKSSMRGALVHDALYQLIREEHLPQKARKPVDRIAHAYWVLDGMWKWRAKRWLRMVRALAGFAADPKNKKKVHEAP